jgi:hypothetical protein
MSVVKSFSGMSVAKSFSGTSVALPINLSSVEKASFALLYSGLLVMVFSLGFANTSAVTGSISALSASLLGVCFLVLFRYRQTQLTNLAQVFRFILPYLVLLGLFSFSLYLLVAYFSILSAGHVSSNYYLFQYLSLILQACLVSLFSVHAGTSLLSLLIGILDIFLLLTLYVSLKYYSTDGFTSLWLQGKQSRYAQPTWTHPTFAFPFPPRVMNM